MSAEKLTPKQTRFVRAYIATGGNNATQAAIAAGYSPAGKGAGAAVAAHRMLRMPHILEAIKEETERRLRAGVALAASVLEELAKNGKSESVRFQAAQALMDRGGMQLASLSEHHVIVDDRRSDDEIRAHVLKLSRELGLTNVLPADVVTPPALADRRGDVEDVQVMDVDANVPDRVANQGYKDIFE
jgi:hypothetical protein